jgi:hypothetical protein
MEKNASFEKDDAFFATGSLRRCENFQFVNAPVFSGFSTLLNHAQMSRGGGGK